MTTFHVDYRRSLRKIDGNQQVHLALALLADELSQPSEGAGCTAPFEHLHQETSVSGIGLWGYDALKAYAQRYGEYYTARGTGLLYRDDTGSGISPAVVFTAHSGSRRLLFVDTLVAGPRASTISRRYVSRPVFATSMSTLERI